MVVPQAARDVAAAVGVLLIATSAASVIGTLIVPRPVANWLTRQIDRVVRGAFILITNFIPDFRRRDRVLSAHAAALLIAQLVAWLLMFFVGFSLIFWPMVSGGITDAFRTAGPGLWQIGEDTARGGLEQAILDFAAITGIITLTLQISYLPTLYAAFNRREQEVALLNARAGVPSWGPELLARTHYALGSGVSTVDTLPDLYADWERWAADVAESHTTYLPLVRFRSPKPLSSWVTALLAVLDSAALMLSLSPEAAPVVPARLCLRAGFLCFRDVARAMGYDIPEEPDPGAGIAITYEQFLEAVARMDKVNFPLEREAADAWPDFVGWRVNYEPAAFAIARELDVVPALWSGPRRHAHPQIPPIRPPEGQARPGQASWPLQGPAAAADQKLAGRRRRVSAHSGHRRGQDRLRGPHAGISQRVADQPGRVRQQPLALGVLLLAGHHRQLAGEGADERLRRRPLTYRLARRRGDLQHVPEGRVASGRGLAEVHENRVQRLQPVGDDGLVQSGPARDVADRDQVALLEQGHGRGQHRQFPGRPGVVHSVAASPGPAARIPDLGPGYPADRTLARIGATSSIDTLFTRSGPGSPGRRRRILAWPGLTAPAGQSRALDSRPGRAPAIAKLCGPAHRGS